MSTFVVPPAPAPTVAVAGATGRFPVHRIYCVGRNYSDHVREMGGNPSHEPPIFFSKPADAVLADGAEMPYPTRTADLHHEVELVVAIGAAGRGVAHARALDLVYGYAVGNDFTRRDLQQWARGHGGPWDTAKGFDHSAAISAIVPVARCGHPRSGRIWLTVNGSARQQADLGDMIWDVAGVVAELSSYFALRPGDLIYTGTPAGVGPVRPGDLVVAGIAGLGSLSNRIVAPDSATAGQGG